MIRRLGLLCFLSFLPMAFSADAPPSAVGVGFQLEKDWGAGANVTLTLTNRTAEAISNWELEFDFASVISPYSHATLVSPAGKHHVFKSLPYAILPASGSLSFQCSVTPGGIGAGLPVNAVFNGAAVAGGPKVLPVTNAALPAIQHADPVPVPFLGTAGSNSFFSTSGNQIVDARGQPVRITGLNWFGFETGNKALHGLWTRGYRNGLDQIKELGFNTLRIPFSNEMLKSGATTGGIDFNKNPDLQGLAPLQALDKVVAYCGQIGLRVILDRHSAKADGYMNEDVWFIPGDAYYTEQRWIADWVMLATRYAGNPAVIGADLFNEPKKSATWGNRAPATDWNKAAERCGNAILAANPDWLIIVEGTEKYAGTSTWWGGNLKGAAAHPVVLEVSNKLVYSMHDYPASVFAQPWFNSPDYPKNLAGVFDGYWGYLYKNNTAPLLLGEFGTKLATVKDQQWLDKLTDYIDGDFDLDGRNDLAPGKQGMSFTFWCFNPNSGDTGGLLNDDWTTVNRAKLAYLTNSLAPMLGHGAVKNSGRLPGR